MSNSPHTSLCPEQLLLEMGKQLGIEGLSFSGEGLCELVFDGGLRTITLHRGGQWISAVLLQVEPLQGGEAIAELALQANFLWRATNGATLSLDGERQLWAQRAMDAHHVTRPEALLNNLEMLLDLADAWRQRPVAKAARSAHSSIPAFFNRA